MDVTKNTSDEKRNFTNRINYTYIQCTKEDRKINVMNDKRLYSKKKFVTTFKSIT